MAVKKYSGKEGYIIKYVTSDKPCVEVNLAQRTTSTALLKTQIFPARVDTDCPAEIEGVRQSLSDSLEFRPTGTEL